MGFAAIHARLLAIRDKYHPTEMQADSPDEYKYDVAISFAGEDRVYARQIADYLRERNIIVFYDEYLQGDLWGKNLYEHLTEVYQSARFFCVVLISKHYAKKMWTNHERRSAQARALKERNEYILPIKLDSSSIPGLLDTVAYIDLGQVSIETVCDTLFNKLLVAIREYLKPFDKKELREYLRECIKGTFSRSFEADMSSAQDHEIEQTLDQLEQTELEIQRKLEPALHLQKVPGIALPPEGHRSSSGSE